MRIRIALTTAVTVVFIPVVLFLALFSGSPSASVAGSTRHEAMSQHRAATRTVRPMSHVQYEKAARLAALYDAVNTSQLAAFYNAVNTSQLAAFYQAINNQQLTAFYNAVNNAQQQAAAAAAAAPAPAPASSGGSWSGPWACIAQHESGGNWAANTGNGFYGGLQFTIQTWQAYGGSGNPANASIAEQEAVAQRVLAAQGWGAWPNTSRVCGL
jgi:hypothetical protein